jgi:hypothetical protein
VEQEFGDIGARKSRGADNWLKKTLQGDDVPKGLRFERFAFEMLRST